VLALTVLACNLALAGAGADVARAAEDPIGAHAMLQVSSPYSFMQRMFAEAAAMHASAIRLDVQPSLVFTDPAAPPDFTGLDEMMALAQQYHLRVVADLLSLPWWIADCQQTGVDMARCGTNDLADYRVFIAAIVAHADPVIRDWEIWNEPDAPSFFSGTPQQYALMLRTAHDAIKQIDPQANVLLGGISATSGMAWLAQVLATPGADAIHAFDIAGVHERGRLSALIPDIEAWKKFLIANSFVGPLWVTEHGYPSDPAYQYDPGYAGGQSSQAAFLAASIPTLIDAGASDVFVTERDNLGGQFASEGLLAGNVLDPPVANPLVVEKPAYAEVATLAGCYELLARDCPGPRASASPAAVSVPPAAVGSVATAPVTISNPGIEPLTLGFLSIAPPSADSLWLTGDRCSEQILEPGQTCTATVRFVPQAGGAVRGALQVPSDDGTLAVPVSAFAPSVASLAWSRRTFEGTGAFNRVGQVQRLVLEVRNPLSTPVPISASGLSTGRSRGFTLRSDRCRGLRLAPGAVCQVLVLFRPSVASVAHATLTLRGGGAAVRIGLRAGPFAPPAVMRVAATAHAGRDVRVVTDQPASVSWRILAGGRTHARGRAAAATVARLVRGVGRSVARIALPHGLRPGGYLLSITPSNAHGTGAPQTVSLSVLP
jgi:hypothetical protein